ncbi:tetratricopeptide repeat protein [Pseudoalteromonas sp. CO325X]|uniref:tetratricopeptide repeat protein n=1 Tax=Pseudoalteromonas sp. CO325X TaxID=1777262 RepID=UPI001023C98C|nr:tetratricopeptide repeat protein [Pseudoalteromonas sp. CO325X]RZF79184.1 tetratricopeptide repeat protein [Pseudoalteromonas sp. CO325X]
MLSKNSNLLYLFLAAMLLTLTFLAYWPSLSVPFYLDDYISIKQNLVLQEGSWTDVIKSDKARWVGLLSFKANYVLFGDSLASLHTMNLFIHLCNILLVGFLTFKLLNLASCSQRVIPWVTLFIMALFALHPLNTQAVTYLVQRYASLATLFFLLALSCYIFARESTKHVKVAAWVIGCLIFGILAFFTKQNAITLIGVLLAFELCFFNRIKLNHVLKTIVIFLIALSILYPLPVLNAHFEAFFTRLGDLTSETDIYSRWQYFCAQLNVIFIYLGKWVFPMELRLEYPYTTQSFSRVGTLLALSAHVFLLCFALKNLKKYTLISFGLFFFYITHSVESALVPIRDIAFEHRTYLPHIGLLFVLAGLGELIYKHGTVTPKATKFILPIIILILGSLTFSRNTLWQSPTDFYEYELSLEPRNLRVMNNLAHAYTNSGNFDKAQSLYERMDELEQSDSKLMSTSTVLSNIMIWNLEQKNIARAEEIAIKITQRETKGPILAKAWAVYGTAAMARRDAQSAEQRFKTSLSYSPNDVGTLLLYAKSLGVQRKFDEAKEALLRAQKLAPNNQEIRKLMNLIRG